MRSAEKLRRAVLRWDHLLMGLALGLPFLVLMALGFVWLIEQGVLLWFIGASLLLSAAMYLMRGMMRRRSQLRGESTTDTAELSVEPDPEWMPGETAVFNSVCQYIAGITSSAQPWDALPEQALEVVNRVAAGLDGKNRGALKFTLPEALLLLETTAARYRAHLRRRLPFSDQVSLATLHWLWRQRSRANLLWKVAYGGGRVARFALNPAAGVLRELEQIMAGGNSRYVTENLTGVLQAVLLEEVAYAAIELYSGRLRFSDEELLQIPLSSARADEKRRALPDLPLRILVVGQVSAGKSTLINTLLEDHLAETDAAATTERLTAYRTVFDGVDCHLLDSEGLDGSSRQGDRMLREMTQADLIIWVVRASRPARDVDAQLRRRFDEWFAERPRRRRPTVITVATGMDQLVDEWPPDAAVGIDGSNDTITAAVQAIARDLGSEEPLPVSLEPQPWNVDAVDAALNAALEEAQRVQRNRRRVEGIRRERRLRHQAGRGVRGAKQGARLLGGRLAGSLARGKGEKEKKPPQ